MDTLYKVLTQRSPLVNAPDAEGRRGVPLGNAGLNPDETLEALTVLRNRGESGPR